jgi:hypothetical protein
VDIKLSTTADKCQVTLVPAVGQTSILSNVVFTLKWKATENLAFGEPEPNSMITINKSGSIHIAGGWKYQIYSGCGLVAGLIEQPIVVNIPKSGAASVTISNDDFLDMVNGRYYVSIGGEDSTGLILTNKSSSPQEYKITLYYDPLLNRFLIKRESEYFTIAGQRVLLLDTTQLIVVRKTELR